MLLADENENTKYTRDSVLMTTLENGVLSGDAPEPENSIIANPMTNSAGSHVKYVIDVHHGDDKWQVTRR
jgi:hypothetical protein